MTTVDQHIAQWRHNRQFLATIDPAYPDWIVTAAFYAALHAVDALLVHDRVAVEDHAARNATLFRVRRYQKVNLHYRQLYKASQAARYNADPAAWVPTDRLRRDMIERELYPLERSVQKLLARDLQLPALHLRA